METLTANRDLSNFSLITAKSPLRPLCVPLVVDKSFSDEIAAKGTQHIFSLWERLGLIYLEEDAAVPKRSKNDVFVNNFTQQIFFRFFSTNRSRKLIELNQPGFVLAKKIFNDAVKARKSTVKRRDAVIAHGTEYRAIFSKELDATLNLLLNKNAENDKSVNLSEISAEKLNPILAEVLREISENSRTNSQTDARITQKRKAMLEILAAKYSSLISKESQTSEHSKKIAAELTELISKKDIGHKASADRIAALISQTQITRGSVSPVVCAAVEKAVEIMLNAKSPEEIRREAANAVSAFTMAEVLRNLRAFMLVNGSERYAPALALNGSSEIENPAETARNSNDHAQLKAFNPNKNRGYFRSALFGGNVGTKGAFGNGIIDTTEFGKILSEISVRSSEPSGTESNGNIFFQADRLTGMVANESCPVSEGVIFLSSGLLADSTEKSLKHSAVRLPEQFGGTIRGIRGVIDKMTAKLKHRVADYLSDKLFSEYGGITLVSLAKDKSSDFKQISENIVKNFTKLKKFVSANNLKIGNMFPDFMCGEENHGSERIVTAIENHSKIGASNIYFGKISKNNFAVNFVPSKANPVLGSVVPATERHSTIEASNIYFSKISKNNFTVYSVPSKASPVLGSAVPAAERHSTIEASNIYFSEISKNNFTVYSVPSKASPTLGSAVPEIENHSTIGASNIYFGKISKNNFAVNSVPSKASPTLENAVPAAERHSTIEASNIYFGKISKNNFIMNSVPSKASPALGSAVPANGGHSESEEDLRVYYNDLFANLYGRTQTQNETVQFGLSSKKHGLASTLPVRSTKHGSSKYHSHEKNIVKIITNKVTASRKAAVKSIFSETVIPPNRQMNISLQNGIYSTLLYKKSIAESSADILESSMKPREDIVTRYIRDKDGIFRERTREISSLHGSFRSRLDSRTLEELDKIIKQAYSENTNKSECNNSAEVKSAPDSSDISYNELNLLLCGDRRYGSSDLELCGICSADSTTMRIFESRLHSMARIKTGLAASRDTGGHISRLVSSLIKNEKKELSELIHTDKVVFRAVEDSDSMVMLIPPTEMDRYQAENGYVRQLPPIEYKQRNLEQTDITPPKRPGIITQRQTQTVTPTITGSLDNLSREDINKLADKIYTQIEARVLRERRRVGM